MTKLREKMIKDMKMRRLSLDTQRGYVTAICGLAKYYNKSPDLLGEDDIHDYLFHLMEEKKLAWSSCNVTASAINFLYNVTLNHREIKIKIPPRKKQKKLPQVLSTKELGQLFNAVSNQKHRLMLMTTYSAGLRARELVRLEPIHIESDRMLIRVDQGKGNKDRYTLLSERLLVELREYWKTYRPKKWLFPVKDTDRQMSRRNALRVYNKAKRKANIKRGDGIHTLRHCFATHLLEAGVDLYTIQKLMGHRSIRTTIVYLQITRRRLTTLKSPLDLMDFPTHRDRR